MSLLLNVKLPPPPNKEMPYLTRFQAKNPPHLLGTTLLNIACEPGDTVASLRAKVEGASRRGGRRDTKRPPRQRFSPSPSHVTLPSRLLTTRSHAALCGEPVEMLRKGGAGGKGETLSDSATLAECGLTTSMGIFEHLWVDSQANQATFWAEYEKMASFVKTQRDLLDVMAK